MANWVHNILDIEGKREDLIKLINLVSAPVPVKYQDFERTEDGTDLTWKEEVLTNPVFSFWNIKKPDDLESYYGKPYHEDTGDIVRDVMMGFVKGNDWYNWNTRNWGCKWDVAQGNDEPNVYTRTEMEWKGDEWVCFRFNTPWSPPIPVLTELFSMFPTLEFDYQYEEEQGWGGEICWADGEQQFHTTYDIPESHADYIELDRPCECTGYDLAKLSTPEQVESMLDWIFEDCPIYIKGQEKLVSLQGTGASLS